ncbi:MAG TPA: Dam family site-specific DNA-(adenine-N6)-methyltransferase [Thermoanaerobaculia bacterium]|nr:Dam family site-specific DNA-(adenine-N6)-methyltransferase [Thermoanaerobaculia bacterium]
MSDSFHSKADLQGGFRLVTTNTPLLKWPGGKRRLLSAIVPLIPANYRRYYEPFLGGGAVFFALRPRRAWLSDTDADLINCYNQVRDNPDAVIRRLHALKNSESDYYAIRARSPRALDIRAARIIYLATLSFNGIFRRNRNGDFNVPYGYKAHLNPCDSKRILSASNALQVARLTCSDFEEAVKSAGPDDVVYFDPPYTVAHGTNGFLKYNARIFSWNDQVRLASIARTLANRGCRVLVSNANHPSLMDLYKDFDRLIVHRPSTIAAKIAHRQETTECLFFA